MDSTSSSLDNLHDIILPEPVALWPPGEGAYFLLVAFVITSLLCSYLFMKKYREDRYRRAGLALLEQAVTVHDISVALKRVALVGFPRDHVASLYGVEWENFLTSSCRGGNFSGLLINPEMKAGKELLDAARLWVRRHESKERG